MADVPAISQPYLLVTPIPYYVDGEGAVWLDQLWHRDLIEHLRYLTNLILAAPRLSKPERRELVQLEAPPGAEIRCVPLPSLDSTSSALAGLPRTIWALWRAVGDASIVHSGIAGWPYPLGWIANPIALLRRKRLIIVVESTPWRLTGAEGEGWKAGVRAALSEFVGRWWVNHAHLAFFTQQGYQESLATRCRGDAYTTPASWINSEDVLEDAAAERSWRAKLSDRDTRLKLIFVGRLIPQKGVDILLEVLRRLEARGVQLDLDVLGEGPRRAACVEASRELRNLKIRLLDPVPYGNRLFEILRSHHAIVVPSLSDEQPRIVFDAYSQALPVIASDTDGLRAHVIEGTTGRLVPCADVEALASTLTAVSRAPDQLREMGLRALAFARSRTHREMHRERHRILVERLSRFC
jgi:glycosyltransferase involved in cell wall biosynthesis